MSRSGQAGFSSQNNMDRFCYVLIMTRIGRDRVALNKLRSPSRRGHVRLLHAF